MSATLESCLYRGRVRHRRFRPHRHDFDYGVTYLYLDLDEVDAVFGRSRLMSYERPNLISFRRRHYHGPREVDLAEAVRDTLKGELGRRPSGPIRVFTQPTVGGLCFNPVSFYYCFEPDGRTLDAVLAEITNTPWGERHLYAMHMEQDEQTFEFDKAFHVSPFMPMEQKYSWRFAAPGDDLSVSMKNLESGEPVFEAELFLQRSEMTRPQLRRALMRYPRMTAKVFASIYWQAALLWSKRAPFFPHPRARST
ncbi:MAG: DUF1365 domain-containing protein [Planctomycetota bacterium]